MPVCTANCISLFGSNLHCVFSNKNLLFNILFCIRMGVRQEVEILYGHFVINVLLSGCWIQVVT